MGIGHIVFVFRWYSVRICVISCHYFWPEVHCLERYHKKVECKINTIFSSALRIYPLYFFLYYTVPGGRQCLQKWDLKELPSKWTFSPYRNVESLHFLTSIFKMSTQLNTYTSLPSLKKLIAICFTETIQYIIIFTRFHE